jgi:hypothetical protein
VRRLRDDSGSRDARPPVRLHRRYGTFTPLPTTRRTASSAPAPTTSTRSRAGGSCPPGGATTAPAGRRAPGSKRSPLGGSSGSRSAHVLRS